VPNVYVLYPINNRFFHNMKRVLFICEGNVARSHIAEAFYNFYAGNKLATSAGVSDVGAKYNYTPRSDVIEVMQEKGIDITSQKIKQIKPENIENIEDIIVLCDPNVLPTFIKKSGKNIVMKRIKDPFKANMEDLRKIRDDIESFVLELLKV